MQPRHRALLLDILHSAEAIEEYIAGYDVESFMRDPRTQDAVLRRLMVIGEAASRLTPEIRDQFNGLPFHKIAGMRNRIVHDYGQIDLEIIWETASLHLPLVRAELCAWFALPDTEDS